MSELLPNHTTSDQLRAVQTTFELPQNYSALINKLEQLALGLDSAFGNLSFDQRQLEIVSTGSSDELPAELLGPPTAAGRQPPPRHGDSHGMGEVEYSRVVSDIWIGVILTLLIVSVIFFVCSCFLYHKFQQWKNSYRSNRNEPVEICRRYPPDFEAESLPSYTIVSGLPTYDDALEEFRKAGIILTPPMPIIKIFESDDSKATQYYNFESAAPPDAGGGGGGDSISLGGCSTCTCGAAQNAAQSSTTATPNNSAASLMGGAGGLLAPQIIELSPDQLASLSQKRLSLQIAFSHSMQRRNSRPRIDLYRQVNRNNLLRTTHAAAQGGNNAADSFAFAPIHRSSSSQSISFANERNLLDTRLHHLHHRGSLC